MRFTCLTLILVMVPACSPVRPLTPMPTIEAASVIAPPPPAPLSTPHVTPTPLEPGAPMPDFEPAAPEPTEMSEPEIPLATHTPTQSVILGRAVTAKRISDNNAPLEITDTFSSSEDMIYLVVEADYVRQGATFFARWYQAGVPFEDSSELTADREYNDTYIEFHLERLGDQFERGDYSVQLFVNGYPTEPVKFTIE